MRTRVATTLIVLLGLASPAAAAQQTVKKGVWGPIEIGGTAQFERYAGLGIGIYNKTISWDVVAPTRPARPTDPADPAYRWPPDIDPLIEGLRRHDIRLSLLIARAPGWANGNRSPQHRPNNVRDYADFLAAAAKRYPSVRLWQVWGEPNGGNYAWLPRVPAPFRTTLTRRQQQAPRDYARLLDRAYVVLKRANRRNKVIGGMTQSGGVRKEHITPAAWMKYLRLPNGRRPRMDMYGHNPFLLARRPDLKQGPAFPGFRDLSDLDTTIRELDRAYPGKRMKLYLSEFAIWDKFYSNGPNWRVSRATAARWTRLAFGIVRRERRVYSMAWAQFKDGAYPGWGLVDENGKAKPAYFAFRDS